MIFKKLIFALFIALIFPMETLQSQWTKANGPYGGLISHMASIGDNVFAGTGDGLYMSNDKGNLWTQTTVNTYVSALYAASSEIFVGINYSGILLSLDYGATWMERNNGLTPLGKDVRCFLKLGSELFAGTHDGIFYSSDNGMNWKSRSNGLPKVFDGNVAMTFISALATDGKKIYAATNNSGVFVSEDKGESWVPANKGLPDVEITALFVSGQTILAGTSGSGAYKADVSKLEWTNVSGSLNSQAVYSFCNVGTSIFAATWDGIFVSEDNGLNWSSSNNGLINRNVLAVAGTASELFAGTWDGVYSSADNGKNWSWKSNGLSLSTIRALIVKGKTLFAGTESGGIFRSEDNGNSWEKVNNGLENGWVMCLAVKGNKIFAGTFGGGIFVSSDNGNSWTEKNKGLRVVSISSFSINGDSTYAATCYGGVYLSLDDGENWIEQTNAQFTNSTIRKYFVTGRNHIAATDEGMFINPNGAGWMPVDLKLSSPEIYSMEKMGTMLFAGTFGNGIIKSTDGGLTWQFASEQLGKTNYWEKCVRSIHVIGNNVVFGTIGGHIFHSSDGGVNWSQNNKEMKSISHIYSFASNNDYLFAGLLYGGVWRKPLTDLNISHIEKADKLPRNFRLFQNYPNPFNPATKINYELSKPENVSISVFNMLGEKICEIVNKYEEAGMHEVIFDRKDLSSGVYFYRMNVGEYSSQKKMILIR